jgi:endonuclease-3
LWFNSHIPEERICPVTPTKLDRVYDLLVAAYGELQNHPNGDALGGLIGTILSQHTSDSNSHRAYQQLRTAFPTWEAVRDAPVADLAATIRCGGLANVKALRIQEVLRVLTTRLDGSPLTLDLLATQSLDEARSFLRSLPGVGPKTAACVLLFHLGQPAMPVDTHVYRVSKRLGLIGARVTPEQAHEFFAAVVPPERVYPLHVNLIRHGRQVCHAQRPACVRCTLRLACAYYAALQLAPAGASRSAPGPGSATSHAT